MRSFNRFATTLIALVLSLPVGCTGTKSEVKTAERKSESKSESAVTLHIGDPAPPLKLAHWVKGSPVDAFETGRVYVVEFWATWCGPCKAGMPHISELQEEYADTVTFMGISDEDQATVDDFFASKGPDDKTWDEIVRYSIALDTTERDTNIAYMKAAGQGGIPTAFVVGKDGHIEWIGHPAGIEDPLQQIVAGKWDRHQFASRLAKQQQQQAVITKAYALVREKQYEESLELFKNLAEENWDNPVFLNGVAWMAAADIPAESTDLDWAEKVALRASELTKNEEATILDTVARVYYEQKNLDAAIEWQQKAVDHGGDASIAETLASYLKERDGEPADILAEAVDGDQADDQASSPQ